MNFFLIISCYEKNVIIFLLDGKRVTGWPGENNEIWNIAPGNLESMFATLIVMGTLKPAD